MKHLAPLTTTALIAALSLAACDDGTTDAPLPEGDTAGSPAKNTPADQDATENNYGSSDSGDADMPVPELDESIPVDDPPAGDRTTLPGISFVMPEGWSQGEPKPMRLFTLIPPEGFEGADLAVNKWPGAVGGFGANVMRWARQAGVEPKSLKRKDYPQVDVDGVESAWISFDEGATNGILAVWVPVGDNPDQPTTTWTFKLTGTPEQVATLAPTVKEWAKSVKFDAE